MAYVMDPGDEPHRLVLKCKRWSHVGSPKGPRTQIIGL